MFWQKKKLKEPETIVVIKDCVVHCKDGLLPGKTERCPRWVILTNNYVVEGKPVSKEEGKCAIAWIPSLLIEIRQALNKGGKDAVPA